MAKFIVGTTSDLVAKALKDSGAIKQDLADIRRIVIDLETGAAAKIYLEMFADNETLSAGLRGGLALEVEVDE